MAIIKEVVDVLLYACGDDVAVQVRRFLFLDSDRSSDLDLPRRWIEDAVSFGFVIVSNKDAFVRLIIPLPANVFGDVGVALGTEDAKMLNVWFSPIPHLVRSLLHCAAR